MLMMATNMPVSSLENVGLFLRPIRKNTIFLLLIFLWEGGIQKYGILSQTLLGTFDPRSDYPSTEERRKSQQHTFLQSSFIPHHHQQGQWQTCTKISRILRDRHVVPVLL